MNSFSELFFLIRIFTKVIRIQFIPDGYFFRIHNDLQLLCATLNLA